MVKNHLEPRIHLAISLLLGFTKGMIPFMKKLIRGLGIFAGIIVGLVVLLLILDALPVAPGGFRGKNPLRLESGQIPHIIPHGGAKDLFPENTIYSYQEMYRRGWNTFEVDLVLTKDGILISHHDLGIGRTTGLDNDMVRDFTYNQLSRYNFAATFENLQGEKPYEHITWENDPEMAAILIPARLSDLFRWYPDSYFILELKDTIEKVGSDWAAQAVNALIDTIRDFSMEDRVVVASFDSGVTAKFRAASENTIPTAAGTNDVLIFSVLDALWLDFFLPTPYTSLFLPIKDQIYPRERRIVESLPQWLQNRLSVYDPTTDTLYTKLVTRSIIQAGHRKNLAVLYWTVNEPEDMRWILELGADGLVTDRPDLMTQVLREMGYSVPAVD